MTVTLLTERHLQFLALKGGCIGLSESTLAKIPHCWKSGHGSYVLIGNTENNNFGVTYHLMTTI